MVAELIQWHRPVDVADVERALEVERELAGEQALDREHALDDERTLDAEHALDGLGGPLRSADHYGANYEGVVIPGRVT